MENKTEQEKIEQEKIKPYLEVRMPMTGNETLCAGNDASYEVRRVNPSSGSCSYVSRFDVRQIYGKRPEMGKAFVLEDNPSTTYGLFLINRYDYSPGSRLKTVGLRFTSRRAHKLACKLALRFAKNIAQNEELSDVVDMIETDKSCLRQDIEELHNQALEYSK